MRTRFVDFVTRQLFRLAILVSKLRGPRPTLTLVLRWTDAEAVLIYQAAEAIDMSVEQMVQVSVMNSVTQVAQAQAQRMVQQFVPPQDDGVMN